MNKYKIRWKSVREPSLDNQNPSLSTQCDIPHTSTWPLALSSQIPKGFNNLNFYSLMLTIMSLCARDDPEALTSHTEMGQVLWGAKSCILSQCCRQQLSATQNGSAGPFPGLFWFFPRLVASSQRALEMRLDVLTQASLPSWGDQTVGTHYTKGTCELWAPTPTWPSFKLCFPGMLKRAAWKCCLDKALLW